MAEVDMFVVSQV